MRKEIILIFIQTIIVEPLLSSKTPTNSSTELWQLYLQLYKSHCGDAVFCDSDTGLTCQSTVVPSCWDGTTTSWVLAVLSGSKVPCSRTQNGRGHMVPAGFPCCLPCSCLPTCSQRHNCCPKIGYQTEDVPHTETEMYKTTRDEDFATGNSTGQTTDKPSTITRAKIKRIREDQPDQETKVERHSDDTHYAQTLRDDYTDSEQENGVEPICFKPQVLNRPNWYLDSDAYVMIAACRETFKDTEIKDKCEAGMNKTSISDMLPVTSRLTGLAYVNKFCLLCNEPIDPSPIFDFWKAKFVNVGALHPMYLVFNPNEYIDVLLENGNIHFAPVASYPVHQCENYAITSCNQTGLWESHDEMMEDICHHGHNLPILHNAMRFKNIACLHCNEGDSFDGILSCGFWVSLDTAARNYSLTLNIRDTAPDGKTEKGLIHESYLTQAVLQLPKAQRCPAGYIALLGFCRRVICPRDQYISNNKCVPLYQRITGLGINVKIDVFPSRPIPRKLSSHFLDELKNIYSTSLSRYITLQIRHISVWFGPQGTKAQDKYYMFDLYLFNANETIDYSRAVNEVQDFFYDLKSKEKLSLLNGTKIGINFKFNHRIESRGFSNRDTSVTAGGIMSPVVGSYFRHSRQNIRISNVNWCYRVAFAQFEDVNEVERLAPDAYLIKPANIIVYQTQYDFINIDQGLHRPFDPSRSHTSVISVLYMCLDLFVDQLGANSSDQANIVESFTPLNDRNDDNADGTTLGPIIIISVFGSLILLVGLYRAMKHTRPSDESQGVGTGE